MIVMPVSWLNYRAGEHSLTPAGLRVQGLYGQVKNPRGRGSRGAINEPSCAETPQRYAQCPFRDGSSTSTFHRVNYSEHPPPMEHRRINFDLRRLLHASRTTSTIRCPFSTPLHQFPISNDPATDSSSSFVLKSPSQALRTVPTLFATEESRHSRGNPRDFSKPGLRPVKYRQPVE